MSTTPNWCSNSLTTDDPALIARLQEPEAEKDLMGHFVPMPEELKGITTGYAKIDGQSAEQWREVDGKNVAIPEAELAELIEKYGTASWYDWSVANWDTKWSADISSAEPLPDGSYRVCFDTAWSPPLRWAQKVSEQYPDRPLTVAYAEQGNGFYGWTTFLAGQKVDEWEEEQSFYREGLTDEDWSTKDDEELLRPSVLKFITEWDIGTGG